MAHNIGRMFWVGERPWHGLGRRLDAPATLHQAMDAGGLNYTVSLRPLALDGEPESLAPQRMAVVRDDRGPGEAGRVLGAVHPGYRLLQNAEAGELFDSLLARGAALYHTGGYLKQGQIVWLQAALPEPIEVGGTDRLNTYLLFSNSHDGTYPIDIRLTSVRVVCNNTLNLAMRKGMAGAVFRRGHGQRIDVVRDAAARFFDDVLAEQRHAALRLTRLAETPCTDGDFAKFLDALLPNSVGQGTAPHQQAAQAARQAIVAVSATGYPDPAAPTGHQPPAEGTWWGALNAVTSWVDHVQTVRQGSRVADALLGAGAVFKERALGVAVARAKVDEAVASPT